MTDYEHKYVDFAGSTLHILAIRNGVNVETYGQSRDVVLPAGKVEEVCAALREAAGLPAVWTVEKTNGDWPRALSVDVASFIEDGLSTDLRLRAAWLLAAADEAEARADRPKLPTAENSVIKVGDVVRVRRGEIWYRPGLTGGWDDTHMARQDFTVLYDPEASG